MTTNTKSRPERVELPSDRHYHTEYGTATTFKGQYGEHVFTAAERAALIAGDSISFEVTYSDGRTEKVSGKLAGGLFTPPDRPDEVIPYVAFKKEIDRSVYAVGDWSERPGQETKFKRTWRGHTFTDEEVTQLLEGLSIGFEAVSKNGDNYEVTGHLEAQSFTAPDGRTVAFVGFARTDGGR